MTNAKIIEQLKGIFPPLVTPFNRSGGIDFKRFRENVRSYAGTGVSGIVNVPYKPLHTARNNSAGIAFY